MSPTRLLIFGIGIVAAIVAAMLAVNLTTSAPEQIKQIVKVPTIETAKVLAATKKLKRGDVVKSGDLKWVEWPRAGLAEHHIQEKKSPKALTEYIGQTVRVSLEQGDPATSNKFVAVGQGFMASVLTKGKRAVSTNVSPGTAAGGFILPDDKVDVLMTRSLGDEVDRRFTTEPVLRNVRVLAIDQEIQEKDGVPVVVGKTATLELTEEQTRILTVAQQVADRITLALRSIRDADQPATSDGLYLVGKDADGQANEATVSVVRYGKKSKVVTKK